MTRIPLKLQKRNKYFRTLHEQANKVVYSFNRFESSFFEYWPLLKTYIFFFVTCIILRIILKFRFSQYAWLCEQVGFLLRQSHIMNCWSCFMIQLQVLIQNLPEVKLLIKHSYRSDITLVVSQPFKKRIVENKL